MNHFTIIYSLDCLTSLGLSPINPRRHALQVHIFIKAMQNELNQKVLVSICTLYPNVISKDVYLVIMLRGDSKLSISTKINIFVWFSLKPKGMVATTTLLISCVTKN